MTAYGWWTAIGYLVMPIAIGFAVMVVVGGPPRRPRRLDTKPGTAEAVRVVGPGGAQALPGRRCSCGSPHLIAVTCEGLPDGYLSEAVAGWICAQCGRFAASESFLSPWRSLPVYDVPEPAQPRYSMPDGSYPVPAQEAIERARRAVQGLR